MAKKIKAEPSKPVDGNLPTHEVVAAHLQEYSRLDSKSAEFRGQIGAHVKAGELDKNIHRAASKLAMKLSKMDDAKRAEFLRHFDHYRTGLKLDQQGDFFSSAPEVSKAKSVGAGPVRDGAKAAKKAAPAKATAEKTPPKRVATRTPAKPAGEPIAAKDAPNIGGDAIGVAGISGNAAPMN